MRKPNPIIILLYIQNSHTKMQDAVSPILILQCRLREQKQSTASHFVILYFSLLTSSAFNNTFFLTPLSNNSQYSTQLTVECTNEKQE